MKRTLLQKADMALADIAGNNGVLQPATAAKFIQLLIIQSKLLQMCTTVPLKSPKQITSKIRFGSRIMRAGSEATAVATGDRVKPTTSGIQHDAKLLRGEIRISEETLEDNIEGAALRQTIMTMLGEAVARDLEELVILGDTASADAYLAQFDGVLKQATSNIVNAGDVRLDKTILKDVLKTMPKEFRRNKAMMKFLTSPNAEIDYRDSIGDRMTAEGDRALGVSSGSGIVGYSGVGVLDIPLFPENVGTGNHCTNVLLLDPKNIEVGIWRDVKIRTSEDHRTGEIIVTVSMRVDALFQEETAVVKATNVKVT